MEADSSDYDSLLMMAQSCRVVATTVGPYLKFGRDLVKACVESKTHYCDLTGEFPFVREMIDTYHDRCAQTGVKIVCSAGFDCIPVDLCTMMAIEALPCEARSAFALFTSCNGSASGGTLDSIKGIRDWVRNVNMFSPLSQYSLTRSNRPNVRVKVIWRILTFLHPMLRHTLKLTNSGRK